MAVSEPRILILTHCFPSNPSDIPGNFIYDLCISLNSIGVNVTVMTQKMSDERDSVFLERSGAKIVYFGWKGGSERFSDLKLSSFRSFFSVISLVLNGRKKLKQVLSKDSYDLILNCWIVPAGLWSFGLNGKLRNAVWALGSDVSMYSNKYIFKLVLGKVIYKSDLLFTNSIHNKNDIKKKFNRDPQMLFSGRPLPIPVKKYKAEKDLKLVFVGRLERIKGPDILISALISSGIKDFILNIIGDGTMRPDLESRIRNNGIQDKVFFLGMKNAAEIADNLSESDYLVISSRSESMPVVFWEAMQVSTPVLSTDVGDVKYYCDKYDVGRVCAADENSLGKLINFVYNLRPLRVNLSKNTRKIADLTDINNTAKKLKDIIAQAR